MAESPERQWLLRQDRLIFAGMILLVVIIVVVAVILR